MKERDKYKLPKRFSDTIMTFRLSYFAKTALLDVVERLRASGYETTVSDIIRIALENTWGIKNEPNGGEEDEQ